MVDTLATLHVPETPAPRVTRSHDDTPSSAGNMSVTTPPEPRYVLPYYHIDGDECTGLICRFVANGLRSKLDFDVDPCSDFYKFVCGKFRGPNTFEHMKNSIEVGTFRDLSSSEVPPSHQLAWQKAAAMYQACVSFASSYAPETMEVVEWMNAMNLDFLNTTRLDSVDPVEMMVRGSLDLGVEAIISIRFDERIFSGDRRLVQINYSKEQETWLSRRRHETPWKNLDDYGVFFLLYGAPRELELPLAKKMIDYEKQLEEIEKNAVNWDKWEYARIYQLGHHTSPYVSPVEWGTFFSTYTEGLYTGGNGIVHFLHSTSIIKKLFEDKEVGKVGLQYLVAWSIYRQLAKFTEPYLFRNEKTATESCFLHVEDVMRLAILSYYFQSLVPPRIINQAKLMVFRLYTAFEKVLNSSSWLTPQH
ncbi:hypothetical protein MTO96_032657 [Rhipicephalus appendiculatus]